MFGDIRDIKNAFLKPVMSNLLFNEIFVLILVSYRSGDVFSGAKPRFKGYLRPFSGPLNLLKRQFEIHSWIV